MGFMITVRCHPWRHRPTVPTAFPCTPPTPLQYHNAGSDSAFKTFDYTLKVTSRLESFQIKSKMVT